ncbi:MAG: hypothetical protein K2L72_03465 [Clostridia bacterium]|nr:hypothetical protein [Clostridia bacterium]
MKFGKKSALALMLAGLTAVSITCGAGCTTASEKYPEYADDKSMWIGGWDVPMNTKADYQMAKDMGLTHMFIDNIFAKKGSEEYFQQLKYCEEVGLKAIVGMDTSLENTAGVPLDETDYSKYPAVDMINVWDEPYYNVFDECAARIDRLNEIYDNKMTLYVNQNPQNPLSSTSLTSAEDFLQKAYDELLSKMHGRKIFSTDVYPLLEKYGSYELDTRWLSLMETYANFTKRYKSEGAEFHMFIQTYSDNGRRDVLSKADITFQVYTDMAFGINGFTYFTYRKSFLSGFGGGCVENDVSCKPTDTYYWAQEVNEEINKFDHVYLSFDWNGVMGLNGTNNTADDPEYENASFNFATPLENLDCAKKVSATEDTLIGQFKDSEGRDGLIVTNFSEPTTGLRDVVSFEFKNANRAIVYRNGERKIYEVKNNKLDLKLDCGEGVFVIPVKV